MPWALSTGTRGSGLATGWRVGEIPLGAEEPRGGKRPLRGCSVPLCFAKQTQTMTSPAPNRKDWEGSAAKSKAAIQVGSKDTLSR